MLYTEAEIREMISKLGMHPTVGDAAIELLERIREEHEND